MGTLVSESYWGHKGSSVADLREGYLWRREGGRWKDVKHQRRQRRSLDEVGGEDAAAVDSSLAEDLRPRPVEIPGMQTPLAEGSIPVQHSSSLPNSFRSPESRDERDAVEVLEAASFPLHSGLEKEEQVGHSERVEEDHIGVSALGLRLEKC